MKAQLKIVLSGKEQFAELIVNKPLTIGRTNRSDIISDDPMMSGLHCRFILKSDRLEVYDMESKNGVYLNGIRVLRSEVFVNDSIKVGSTVITLEPMRMDPDSTSTLTFPGPFKERVEHELKIDYTANHRVGGKDDFNIHSNQQNIRKKLITPAPPTKAQVKSEHKTKALVAISIDIVFLILVAGIGPLKILSWMSQKAQIEIGKMVIIKADIDHNRMIILAIMVILAATIFSLINFRRKGFSIGEKLVGFPNLMKP